MNWLFGEPRLDELLSDPVIVVAMARDGVDPSAVRSLLREVERARMTGIPQTSRSPVLEQCSAA